MSASSRTLAFAVHAIAMLFWTFVGVLAGERSSIASGVMFAGNVCVAAGMGLLRRRHQRARALLVLGDLVPLVLVVGFVAFVVWSSVREGTFGDTLIELGPSLALFLPAALGPLLIALNLPRSTSAR